MERLHSLPVESLHAHRRTHVPRALVPRTSVPGTRVAHYLWATALLLVAPVGATPLRVPQERTTHELAAAAARLDAEESAHAADWLTRVLGDEEDLGTVVLRNALALETVAREGWPLVPERTAYGPGDPALAGLTDLPEVEPLAADDTHTAALLAARGEALDHRRPHARLVYDDVAGELRRVPRAQGEMEGDSGAAAVLQGAALGFAPETDAAEALLERALDTGAARAELAALERAWVDESGRAHAGLSLLDALRGDEPLPLRPLDLVGVVRAVDGPEAATWPPAPEALDALNARVEQIAELATVQRALRRNLARTALHGVPALDPGAGGSLYRLHAVWRTAEGDASRVREDLPVAGAERAWFDAWAERYRKQSVRKAALRRSKQLVLHSTRVRATLGAVLDEYGAFDGRGTTLADVPNVPGTPPPAVRPASQPVSASPEPGIVTPAAHTPPATPTGPPPVAWDPAALPALRTGFEDLRKRERRQLLEACVEAARASGALQVELIERWTAPLVVVEKQLPVRDRLEAHDAKQYRGGPPRREVRKGNRHWESLARLVSGNDDWERTRDIHYEFATGRIARDREERDDAWRTLELLLEGVLPDQDLAEALVLRELDRGGPVRKEAEYFAHTYADREARAYQGITLFDAWTSNIELEIPDPDARAYAAKLWNDTSVPVPLGAADHALWYPRMELSLKRLRDHRDVTRALAALWFQGRPELPGQYENSTDILQASIALAGEDPEELRSELQEYGAGFPGRALQRVQAAAPAGWDVGNARRDTLIEGREAIRQAVLRLLQERDLLAP